MHRMCTAIWLHCISRSPTPPAPHSRRSTCCSHGEVAYRLWPTFNAGQTTAATVHVLRRAGLEAVSQIHSTGSPARVLKLNHATPGVLFQRPNTLRKMGKSNEKPPRSTRMYFHRCVADVRINGPSNDVSHQYEHHQGWICGWRIWRIRNAQLRWATLPDQGKRIERWSGDWDVENVVARDSASPSQGLRH